jgi:hypothetical protein
MHTHTLYILGTSYDSSVRLIKSYAFVYVNFYVSYIIMFATLTKIYENDLSMSRKRVLVNVSLPPNYEFNQGI